MSFQGLSDSSLSLPLSYFTIDGKANHMCLQTCKWVLSGGGTAFLFMEKPCMGSFENSFQYSWSVNVSVLWILLQIDCNIIMLFSFELYPLTLETVENQGFVLLALVKLSFLFSFWFIYLFCFLFMLRLSSLPETLLCSIALKPGSETILLSFSCTPTPTVRMLCQHNIIRKPVLLTFQAPTENAVNLLRRPYLQDLFNQEVG